MTDRVLGFAVGNGDGRGIELGFHFHAALEMARDQLARGARGLQHDVERAVEEGGVEGFWHRFNRTGAKADSGFHAARGPGMTSKTNTASQLYRHSGASPASSAMNPESTSERKADSGFQRSALAPE